MPRGEANCFVQPVERDTRTVAVQSLVLYTTNMIRRTSVDIAGLQRSGY